MAKRRKVSVKVAHLKKGRVRKAKGKGRRSKHTAVKA